MINKFLDANMSDIAKVLGITKQSVFNKMSGKTYFKMSEVKRLYEEYGIEYSELESLLKLHQDKLENKRLRRKLREKED